ncbi:RNA dependent RNA polymerase-domain-containing protein [Cristinia sonorae]|uniref:RNA-dependent RNA polymerase n=1 Tax=Cristinia sonorae TaxID=1940300 RepID=A0A8K0UQS2_9AGAR|nr:RNA dependent RNA polymerase-domain-containing protein [Cristinia sonorae]
MSGTGLTVTFHPPPSPTELAPYAMEIFMHNIAITAKPTLIKTEIARALHTPQYKHHSRRPINFYVVIFPRKGGAKASLGRSGKLTLPSAAIGGQFLAEFGGKEPKKTIVVGTKIKFVPSRDKPRQDIVDEIRREPFLDPVEEERQIWSAHTRDSAVALDTFQVGWHCRDETFSIEWEQPCRTFGRFSYNGDRREFRIYIFGVEDTRLVIIPAAHISWANVYVDSQGDAAIILELSCPPSFETAPAADLADAMAGLHLESAQSPRPCRQRWPAIDPVHADVAPYTSHILRLICSEMEGLARFRSICNVAHIPVDNFNMQARHLGLFSQRVQAEFSQWLRQLDWKLAYQVEALTRKGLVDMKEALSLRGPIARMVATRNAEATSTFLRYFITQMKTKFQHSQDSQEALETVVQFFNRIANEQVQSKHCRRIGGFRTENDTFQCLHVTITPTTMYLEGPYPERLNRVIRWYPKHHDCFLRVNFVDEAHLQFRFDRDVDGRSFIERRVGSILKDGLEVAGRRFNFLAYSQSALKEHAVWFVKDFYVEEQLVTAASIIKRIGNFEKLSYDPKLIYCPARYGARISQSFTATDASLSAEAEEIFILEDIKDSTGQWLFTDGIGTISPELARAIWKDLCSRGRRAVRPRTYPRAYQIRFMGSKGMLSVDHSLSGRAICIRPSMIKFDAPNSQEIEIARAFDRPGPLYLNRPLIMILEALGVKYEVFKKLQDDAVYEAQHAVQTVSQAAELLEKYGLGASYRLPSVMLSLTKLGIDNLQWDEFWEQMMDFSVNHVLRELKHHARIPVKDAWNLVGVADIHGYLKEGEVFVHIEPVEGGATFLDGPIMVSRSPTIHPGDVQVVRAIGRPPKGSPFEKETLRNCIVFSTKGKRPLPTYLGGGDLDGDVYCCTTLPELLPTRIYEPAAYTTADRLMLNRRSTMRDVADFVTEYIVSDRLGIIAHTWLVIADQSKFGIFDRDCLTLSDLHSDAVDYPKSGKPVPLEKIPRYKSQAKPDWCAPETGNHDPKKYYKSFRAIGQLFRAIDLPATLRTAERAQSTQRDQLAQEQSITLRDVLKGFDGGKRYNDVAWAIRRRVSGFIMLNRHEEDLISEIWDLAESYRLQLQTICADHSLSRTRNAILTEEEAVVGTIVAKCTQPRKRKDTMSKLREQTSILVQEIEHQLVGELGILPQDALRRAWVAYRISLLTAHQFGGRSFGWIAMRAIFDSIRIIESDT